MEFKGRKRLLLVFQVIIACIAVFCIFINTKNAVLYGIIGIISIVAVHWFFRDKSGHRTNWSMTIIVMVSLALNIGFDWIGKVVFKDNSSWSTFFILASFIPLLLLFVYVLSQIQRLNRSK